MESNSHPPPLRPILPSNNSSRRSFLQKLPVNIPKISKAPHPRRFIPFRSGGFSKAKSSLPSDPSAKPLAQLVIKVLEGRNLIAKDKNGLSDPFCVVRYNGKRIQSTTIKKCLNPVWSDGDEMKLSVDVYEEGKGWREAVEVVLWDWDRVGKSYLGEISVGLQDFFAPASHWIDGIPPVGFFDEANKPTWFPIRSSRSRSTVSGDLLVQIGFIDPGTASKELSPETRESLLKVLEGLSEEYEGSRRASKEERILLASPTESVGTTLISDNLPLGTSPPRTYLPLEEGGDGEGEEVYSSDSESSESSNDDNKSVSSGASTDDEAEGEEDGTEEAFSPDEPVIPSSDYFSIPQASKPSEQESIDPTSVPPSFPSIPITLTPPPLSPATAPVNLSLPASPSITLLPPSNPRTSSTTSIRRGLTSFMKRKGSSVANLKSTGGAESEGGAGTGTASDVASGSGSNGPEKTKEKVEKKRRFSRKKSKDVTTAENEGDEEGDLANSKKSRGKRFRRNKGKNVENEGEGENEKESKKSRKTRRTKMGTKKRDYKYEDDDDIFGLVQIEIRSAKDLPKFKNMLKTGWDMDPFVVISFGQKVFRTRVIRHQLNPVWDEKLFFHVRKTEVGWNINFNVYDWDKMSSNDYVGEISVPLEELLGSTIQPDERGLYPATHEGKLIGDDFQEHDLAIQIEDPQWGQPTLQIRAKFTPYDALRQQFWRTYLRNYDIDESNAFSHLEIFSMLDSLGSTLSKDTISSFFSRFGKTPDMELTSDEVVICLEQELRRPFSEKRSVDETLDSGLVTPKLDTASTTEFNESSDLSTNMETIQIGEEVVTNQELGTVVKATKSGYATSTTPSGSSPAQLSDDEGGDVVSQGSVERVINIRECPLCRKPRLNNKMEVDIVTHLGICSSTDPRSVNRIVVGSYVTASQAQRKWFTKVISKATKGAYSLGANSANIIVQDRQTGTLQEEKISTYIRLGIRLAYKGVGAGGGMEGNRIRRMLESMSIKQGIRFNSPNSVREIEPFIAFHNLPMSEVLEPMSSFKTFNEFFYRKLKPEARPVADPNDPRTLVSPADCRAMFFETITEATTFWIKGREFSISRLLGDAFKDKAHLYEGGSLAIFRLAPQDYHRYHSPVDGIVGPYHKISGKYFTVNPMAVRSAIDIYGENIRVVGAIYSPVFGEVMNVWVGAMLVGSIAFTKQEGEAVARGEEIGYFAFGGSTIINIFAPGVVKFDEDLLTNSRSSLETLVRMGSRIGRKIGA